MLWAVFTFTFASQLCFIQPQVKGHSRSFQRQYGIILHSCFLQLSNATGYLCSEGRRTTCVCPPFPWTFTFPGFKTCFLSTNQSAIQAHKAVTKRSSLIDLRSGSASCKLPKSPVLGAGQDILAKREREQSLYRGRTKCPRWCFRMYGDCGAGFQSRGVVNHGVG